MEGRATRLSVFVYPDRRYRIFRRGEINEKREAEVEVGFAVGGVVAVAVTGAVAVAVVVWIGIGIEVNVGIDAVVAVTVWVGVEVVVAMNKHIIVGKPKEKQNEKAS